MKRKQKKILYCILLLILFGGIGCLADRIPFYLFPESEEMEVFTVFSLEWWQGMLPLIIIVFAGLLLAVIILKFYRWKNKNLKHRESDVRLFHIGTSKKGKPSWFSVLRWSCMIVSSGLIIYGGKLFQQTFHGVEIPIFACPFNEEQLIGASCYYLSHIQILLEEGATKIIIFLLSFLGSSILLGRILCGFICPMGFVQDVINGCRQKLHMESVDTDEKMYQKLNLVKFLLLIVFLGLGFLGGDFCRICPAVTLSPAFAGFHVSLYVSGFFMIILTALSFLKRRSFCNICPLGYLLGLLHRFSLFKLKKNGVSCTECGACYEACPMGIKSILTTREGKDEKNIDVTTADCIMCGECIRKCPENDALSLTFAGKKVYTASRMAYMRENTINKFGKEKRHGLFGR